MYPPTRLRVNTSRLVPILRAFHRRRQPWFICVLLVSVVCFTKFHAFAQQVIPVGPAGSYASMPSPTEDGPDHSVSGTIQQALYIDPSVPAQPIPTNKWWTDLLVSQYSGALWPRPFTVSANAQGIQIYYPTTWNTDGTGMQLNNPLEIGGTVLPSVDASDVMMADFEGTVYPTGWTVSGAAFGAGPANGTLSGQVTVSGYIGNRLVNSFLGGDGPVGVLSSPTFTVDRNFICFLVGGGNHPGVAEVRLVIGGQTVRAATGVNSENLDWVTWDVSTYSGQSAQIQIVDNATGGWGHILCDHIFRTNSSVSPAIRYNPSFAPADARALRWGDWNVSYRMKQAAGQFMDVSLTRGVPFVWLETNALQPRLKTGTSAQFYNAAGGPLTFPVTTDRFVIEIAGRAYGVHAPTNSSFNRTADRVDATLSAPYVVISALPDRTYLNIFHTYAFAVPRNTQMSWTYSQNSGSVTTNWQLTTEALQGSNTATLQGWLPHHYRGTSHNLAFQAFSYATPRGPMKCSIGSSGWQINYPFEGIAPVLPAPRTLGKANEYQLPRMQNFVDRYAAVDTYGGDTYWGGKDLIQFADYMLMAKQIGSSLSYETLKSSLRVALSDWFSYTPGETEVYFARYPTWRALIGFNDSYGSFQFTDNHFHYGYLTLSAALLSYEDPQFAASYGPMATLVAKQYANWDRSDTDFPFLRTFDVWGGHSYAGGYSSPGGNNQESSSEAIQSWAGLFLLGDALGNTQMRAVGAMGYAVERNAVREYWLNYHGNPNAANAQPPGNFPSQYTKSTTGILFDGGQAYATYFSADPAWIYGIQWLPAASHLAYLGWDSGFAKSLLADMFNDRPVVLGAFVPGDNRWKIIQSGKKWWGIGATMDRNAAIADLKDAITNGYIHNSAYVGQLNTGNPFYNPATGGLYFTVSNGRPEFPAQYWTPSTLPAALTPHQPASSDPDAAPTNSTTYTFLGTNYSVDTAQTNALYKYDVLGYLPGTNAAQAASVYDRMGDAVGNVVLGFVQQYDPDFYAEMADRLFAMNSPLVTSRSMAGIVYYNAFSRRGLGAPIANRWTSVPSSQVYYDAATTRYHYVVYNPADTQQSVTVFDNAGLVGSFPVPGRTLVDHSLDQVLTTVKITASTSAKTIPIGQTVQFTVTGYDQYQATHPLGTVNWSVSAGGTINSAGLFTATTNADPVVVTVTSSGKSDTWTFRVAPAPYLNTIQVIPAFTRASTGELVAFAAAGLDQYGDPISAGTVTWTTSVPSGSITAGGVFTAGAGGRGHVIAASGTVRGSAIVATAGPAANVAQGKSVTASTSLGGNGAANAVDGNSGTRWESQFADNQWIVVDLGSVYDLTKLEVVWEPAYASKYEIQTGASVTGPWTTVTTVNKTSAATDSVPLTSASRYLRLNLLTRGTTYGFSIFELRAFGYLTGDSVTAVELLVNPKETNVLVGKAANYVAYAFDSANQGGPVAASWNSSGGGSITSTGVFTASTAGGPFTITATKGALSATAQVTVVSNTATVIGNLALNRPVTVSSAENAGTAGSKAVDGSMTSRWSSAFADNQFIEVDLGSAKSITQIVLRWEAAYGRDYRIQARSAASDPWTTIVTRTNGTGSDESFDLNTSARYVRMQGDVRGTPWGFSLWEFIVNGPMEANQNIALGKTAVSSSNENGAMLPGNATDGALGTRWSSGRTDTEWIYIDLGTSLPLTDVTLRWEAAYGRQYAIEGTNSLSGSWTVLATKTNGTGGVDTLPVSGSYRYVRMRGIERGTVYGYSLWEFEIR
jgi:endoglucanase Acf2